MGKGMTFRALLQDYLCFTLRKHVGEKKQNKKVKVLISIKGNVKPLQTPGESVGIG